MSIIHLALAVCLVQPVDEFAARRQKIQKEMGAGGILVSRSSRFVEEFKINKNFYWLTGVSDERATLCMTPDDVVLYVPERSPRGEVWDGTRLYPGADARKATGIKDIRPLKQFSADLEKMLDGKSILYLSRRRLKDDVYDMGLRFPVRFSDPRTMIARRRLIKSEEEMKLLRHAIRTTCEAQREAMRRCKPGMRERELAGVIEATFRAGDSERNGFPTIVGSGPNSCILHYRAGSRKMKYGDLLVIDIGAEYRQYTADVTRTIPAGGRFTDRQKQIYNIVLKAQQTAARKARPGMTLRKIHGFAVDVIAEGLIDLDLIEDRGDVGKYFMHGTCHWLGLDVHDVGGRGGKADVGSVFTIEPGIYIANEQLGVRIEDDYLMTKDGVVCLSDHAPRTVEEIEAMMRGK